MGRTDSFVLSIDQGTSGTSASLYDSACQRVASVDIPVRSYFPQAGWVEQDPQELLASIKIAFHELVAQAGLQPGQIVSLGMANQGECLLVWDMDSGRPVYNLIGWQCVRSADYCRRLSENGQEDRFRSISGLPLDPEWPATKIPWLLENVPEIRNLLEGGRLAFSQSDSWFMRHLTVEKTFRTDHTTASRSGLYNLETRTWDLDLIRLFQADSLAFPEVRDSASDFGTVDFGEGWLIPWRGNALDQPAALLGQACLDPGDAKVTYGTCAAFWYTHGLSVPRTNAMEASVAWSIDGHPTYALVGEAITGGAAVVWLRKEFKLSRKDSQLAEIARLSQDQDEVIFVPALSGLGAPYREPNVRAAFYGMTAGTGLPHLVRAVLNAVAFGVRDILEAFESGEGRSLRGQLKVDGGMSRNDYLMQFQADILGRKLIVPQNMEGTSSGVAFLAGYASDFYPGPDVLKQSWITERVYEPQMPERNREELYQRWKQVVQHTIALYREIE